MISRCFKGLRGTGGTENLIIKKSEKQSKKKKTEKNLKEFVQL